MVGVSAQTASAARGAERRSTLNNRRREGWLSKDYHDLQALVTILASLAKYTVLSQMCGPGVFAVLVCSFFCILFCSFQSGPKLEKDRNVSSGLSAQGMVLLGECHECTRSCSYAPGAAKAREQGESSSSYIRRGPAAREDSVNSQQ
jgi:hypothetical protein